MDHRSQSGSKRDLVPATILAIIIAYTITLCIGWPQTGTQKIASQLTEHEARNSPATVETMVVAPPFWTVLPFVLLLAGIAVLPLISHTSHWWESNLNRFKVAGGLALATMAYYAFLHNGGLEGHWPALHMVAPSEGSVQTGLVNTILANAMLEEFIPFIVLLFSLYTISGGIRIAGDFEARPTTNAIFMGVGAVLASLIGTTGAAMLLIRPLLETNRERKHVAHTVVFFIFIVCNCGGCLLPIGDPPLFLGYLEGVPFLWTLRLWPEWLFVNGLLIVTYLLLDSLWFHRRETPADIQRDIRTFHRLRIAGWQLNAPLLLGIVLAVALLDPGKTVSRHRLASVDVPARDRAAVPGRRLVTVRRPTRARRQLVHIRRDHRGRGPVRRHLHLHATGFANTQHQRKRVGPYNSASLLLGFRQSLERTRQRADVPGVFQGGSIVAT